MPQPTSDTPALTLSPDARAILRGLASHYGLSSDAAVLEWLLREQARTVAAEVTASEQVATARLASEGAYRRLFGGPVAA